MPTLKAKGKTCIYKIIEKDNYDQAIDYFAKALEIDSFNADVYYGRGTRFDKGNLQQVPADIGKALNLKPEDQRNKEAAVNIIIPSVGSVTDQRTAEYVTNIAKRLNAQLIVLRILSEKETEAQGEQSLGLFVENGKIEKVPVNIILRRGDIAAVIIETAQEKSVDLIILGVSRGEIVAEWMNAGAMERTDIPVLLIPKWVRGAGDRRRMAEREPELNLEKAITTDCKDNR